MLWLATSRWMAGSGRATVWQEEWQESDDEAAGLGQPVRVGNILGACRGRRYCAVPTSSSCLSRAVSTAFCSTKPILTRISPMRSR